MSAKPITFVYVDGFNLYYGLLKGSPYKWLDLRALCRAYLPNHNVTQIKNFTARVSGRPEDPDKPIRQAVYLRALATLPEVQVVFGHFLSDRVRMPLSNPKARGPRTVEVIRTSEKGSDVNLATHLLLDCFQKHFQVSVIVSNDSDLYLPIKAVRRMGCPVGLLNPQQRPSRKLLQEATFLKDIHAGVLARCQFPATIRDAKGEFHKPAIW